MEESTFRELMESKFHSPEITDVIYDFNQLEELILNSVKVVEKGFDTVWDKTMFNYHFKYLQNGFEALEKNIEERDLKIRLIVDASAENIHLLNSIKYYDIRHLDNVRVNFGILDERVYMIYFFNKETEKPEQGFLSNSKVLVDKQRQVFQKLWDIAIPISIRSKELDHQVIQDFPKTLTDFMEIKNEVYLLIELSKKDLIIYSSNKILGSFIYEDDFWKHFPLLLKGGVNIKILTDDFSSDLMTKINEMNPNENNQNFIQIANANKLGNINEFIIISDGKHLLKVNYDKDRNFVALFSNKEHQVLVQQILFEKYWNEIRSLAIARDNISQKF